MIGPDGFTRLAGDAAYDRLHGVDGLTQTPCPYGGGDHRALIHQAKAEVLREFADTLGVNVGDEDNEWWSGYRQGQREALRKAVDRAAFYAEWKANG